MATDVPAHALPVCTAAARPDLFRLSAGSVRVSHVQSSPSCFSETHDESQFSQVTFGMA